VCEFDPQFSGFFANSRRYFEEHVWMGEDFGGNKENQKSRRPCIIEMRISSNNMALETGGMIFSGKKITLLAN
jgi:hypothetical protein